MDILTTVLALVSSVLYVWVAFIQPRHLPGIPRLKRRWAGLFGDLPHLFAYLRETKSQSNSRWFADLAEIQGPIHQLVLGTRVLVLVNDAQETEDILARRKDFDKSREFTQMFVGMIDQSHMTMKSTPTFKLHRRLFGQSMTTRYLSQMTPRLSRSAKELLLLWDAKRLYLENSGKAWSKAFEAHLDLTYFTTDVIVDLACGGHWGCVSSAIDLTAALPAPPLPSVPGEIFEFPQKPLELFWALQKLFQTAGEVPVSPFPVFTRFITQQRPSYKRAMAKIRTFLRKEISRRHEEIAEYAGSNGDRSPPKVSNDGEMVEGDADCIVGSVLEQGGGKKLTLAAIEDELIGIMLGGQDTTATTLAWTVKYLARAPQVQRTLRKELVSRLSSLGETYDPSSVEGIHLLKFSDVGSDHTPYLEAVVAECLRCAGVGVAAERDALEDTVVLGHAIPKGVTVLCYASQVGNWNNAEKQKKGWTIASDSPVRSATSRAAALKGVWDDECGIMDFKPERWLSYDSDGKVRYDANKGWNMQFGGGTRGCFGKNLAIIELKITIATLSSYFFFDSVPKGVDGFEPKEIMTLQPVHSYVSLKKWSDMGE